MKTMMSWQKAAIAALLLLNIFLIYQLLLSDHGMYSYFALRAEHDKVTQELKAAEKEAQTLSDEIRWLKEDQEYLEMVIRKELYMIDEDEVLYVFPSDESDRADVLNGTSAGVDHE